MATVIAFMAARLPGNAREASVITGNYRVITIPRYITGNQGVRGRLEAVWRLERTTANPRGAPRRPGGFHATTPAARYGAGAVAQHARRDVATSSRSVAVSRRVSRRASTAARNATATGRDARIASHVYWRSAARRRITRYRIMAPGNCR